MRSLEPVRTDNVIRDYAAALKALRASPIPFLIGGAHGLARYLGVERETKDLDIFIRPEDIHRTLSFFDERGYRTELTFPHWLGKVFCGTALIDIIFSSGNAV